MEPILELRDVSLAIRERPVLVDVNLSLETGAFLGLIGPNGAGKTVLLRTILGLIRPDRGTVRVLGKAPQQVRGKVGYVPQYARFDYDFPISVLGLVLMGRIAERNLFRRYSAADRMEALAALERVEMAEFAERQIGRLSGGQLQRVLIARALASRPALLLLDEPTASLDSRVGSNVYQLLDDLSQSMSIILVSHDIGVISRHVKTIACLNRRLHYHASRELSGTVLEEVYGCPIDLIAHGHAHRVLDSHEHGGDGCGESSHDPDESEQ